MNQIWKVHPQFSTAARALRSEFDSTFGDARSVHPSRFKFEPWSVAGQYYQLRTPAYEFFSARAYLKFHHALVDFGRTVLGCHDVSPPWLSLYLDGHFQEMHCDAPHGPWAFVYSLTEGKFFRLASGGKTEIFNPIALQFGSVDAPVLERDHCLDSIAPKFNQLTVFDGRYPHRVSPVRGVFDPKDARVVIHGWFLNPRPFVSGPASVSELATHLEAFQDSNAQMGLSPRAPGVFSFKLSLSAQGETKKIEFLGSTLYGDDYQKVKKAVRQFWPQCKWKRRAQASTLVVPLTWD